MQAFMLSLALTILSSSNLCLARATIITTPSLTSSTTTTLQSPNGTYIDPDVPTGVPIPGNYNGQYRPQVHFSPPKFFMNDPNGMFRDDNGTWHLYYQYNPKAYVAGYQHWGHATSNNLYHWVNQPIALFPPKMNLLVFSGSAVTDPNNTSGFFPSQKNGVVAIYTLAEYYSDGSPGPETQAISYSLDGGYSFTPYKGNPVIPSTAIHFRDPKVERYGDHWVMAVAYAQEFAIGIFTSPNLINWTHASNFTSPDHSGQQWECPNLVPMPIRDDTGRVIDNKWLMAISINPGAPLGGSIMLYYTGSFNGTHFEADGSASRIADFGKDNYASQFFYGLSNQEDPVSIGWASNWQYTDSVPTAGEGWRSAMSLPRRSHLIKDERVGLKMTSIPYDMSPVKGEVLASKDAHTNGSMIVDFSHVYSNTIYWEINATGIPEKRLPSTAALNFTFSSAQTGEHVDGGVHFAGDKLFYLDRGGARGFKHGDFTDKFFIKSSLRGNSWSMSGVLDRSIMEVFLNGGVDSATTIFFSTQPMTSMVLSVTDLPEGMSLSVRVNALKSGWAPEKSFKDRLDSRNQHMGVIGADRTGRLLGALE